MKSTQKIYSLQDLSFLTNITNIKVGILGGTFNPAHTGHLMISKRVLNIYKLNYVIWLVANQNPIKPKNTLSIFRRAKQALSIVDDPRILVSTAEHDCKTKYTYDSLSCLINHYPNMEITWMMGRDNASHFMQWENATKILKLCHIIIFDRPCSTMHESLEKFGFKPTMNLDNPTSKNIIFDNNELYDISSTQIRQQQKRGTH